MDFPVLNGYVEVTSVFETEEKLEISFHKKEKVMNLKERIAQKFKYSVDEFALFFDFEWLNEDDYIDQYKIEQGSMIKYAHFEKIAKFKLLTNDRNGGAYSNSFNAQVISTGEIIKIKQYKSGLPPQGLQNYKPMIREIVSLNRIGQHPRFVQLKAFYMQHGTFYMGLEYMKGGSLHNLIKNHISLDEKNIARLSQNILEALNELHEVHRIYHGYLNSFNILLDGNNDAKISGFSLSRFFAGATCSDMVEGFTVSKLPLIYNFSAPEILNQENAGLKSDIWSFGAILIEMVTGRMPFHSLECGEIIHEVTTKYAIPFQLPSQPMDSSIGEMINLCLKKEMKDRPSAKELLKNFSNFFNKHAVPVQI